METKDYAGGVAAKLNLREKDVLVVLELLVKVMLAVLIKVAAAAPAVAEEEVMLHIVYLVHQVAQEAVEARDVSLVPPQRQLLQRCCPSGSTFL